MRALTSILHQILLYVLIGVTTLTLAMLISMTLQDSISNLRRLSGTSWPVQLIMVVPVWMLLCLPKFRFQAIIAPSQGTHIVAQIGFGVIATVCILLSTVYAAEAPLSLMFWQKFQSGLIALPCGGLVILTALAGVTRAIVFASTKDLDLQNAPSEAPPFLGNAHHIAKSFASLTALVMGGSIVVSVLILGRPTSIPTIIYTLIFLLYAVLLIWPRFKLEGVIAPSHPRHAATQLGLMFVAIYSVERITRAMLFHSSQFSSFADIEAVYPAVENAAMLPFILFGLIGVARAFPKSERANPKITASEVFG